MTNYHSHITVTSIAIIPKGWKRTDIILEDSNKVQQDIMLTKHYCIGKAGVSSLQDITQDVVNMYNSLKAVRYKIEQDNEFSRNITNKEYFECHIKMYENDLNLTGFKRSRNPNQIIGNRKVYFWNKRWYEGQLSDINEEIGMIKDKYSKHILELKKEHVLIDSRHSLDSWWA